MFRVSKLGFSRFQHVARNIGGILDLMIPCRFFHESCQFYSLRFWKTGTSGSSSILNLFIFQWTGTHGSCIPIVFFYRTRTGGSLKRFQTTARHCYLPSSQLCHVSFAVSKFEVGEREREREREIWGRQKKDQNNIEGRSAALAHYTTLDKNVMSCISNVMSCTEMRCQNQISHYYITIHHPF